MNICMNICMNIFNQSPRPLYSSDSQSVGAQRTNQFSKKLDIAYTREILDNFVFNKHIKFKVINMMQQMENKAQTIWSLKLCPRKIWRTEFFLCNNLFGCSLMKMMGMMVLHFLFQAKLECITFNIGIDSGIAYLYFLLSMQLCLFLKVA